MFWNFLFAHFLADYALQPDSMAAKKDQIHMVILHLLTHILVLSIISWKNLSLVWPYILILVSIHFFIDWVKKTITARKSGWFISGYVIDQGAHIFSIWGISTLLELNVMNLQNNLPVPLLIIATGYLLVTYVWFISERILAHFQPQYLAEVNEQAWSRMVVRGFLLTLLLSVSPGFSKSFLQMSATIFIPYLCRRKAWRAFLTDIIVVGIIWSSIIWIFNSFGI